MASQTDKDKFLDPNADERTLLLFTGGRGEPKCVDVERCIEDLDESADISGLGVFNIQDKHDFTDACPRVPLSPISFYFTNDPSRTSSSFRGSRGVQFSYQAIYKKGFLSALAPYSNVAVPPSILNAGKSPFSEVDFENTCVLEIPKQSAEVEGIRLIVREGNDGVARKIDDIYFGAENQNFIEDNGTYSNYAGIYEYFNDSTGSILNETDRLKTFDAVPRDAKAQEVAGDRLVYGNYTDGYSNIQTDCTLQVEFTSAPPPGYSFDIDARPVVFRRKTEEYSDATITSLDSFDAHNRYLTSAGVLLDDVGLPDVILPGRYEYTVNMAPSDNFHQFLGQNDAPNSLENVNLADVTSAPNLDNYDNNAVIGQQNITYGALGEVDDVFMPLDPNALTGFGFPIRNFSRNKYRVTSFNNLEGKGIAIDAINQTDDDLRATWVNTSGDPSVPVGVGESFTCPMIYKGGNLSFSATLNLEAETPKEDFMRGLVHALWGLPPSENPILAFNGSQEYPLSDDEWFSTHSFDLGLNPRGILADSIIQEDDDIANLIFAIGVGKDEGYADAYGIVNSARLNFCLEPARGSNATQYFGEEVGSPGKYNFEDDQGNTRSLWGLKLTLANAQDVDIKTCIPDPSSQFGSLISNEVYLSSQSAYDTFSNPEARLRASLFTARATSKWDYDIHDGSAKISWPSIERNLSIPATTNAGGGQVTNAVAYGPANQCFDTPNNSGFPQCFIEYVQDDNGISFPSAGTVSFNSFDIQGPGNDFRTRQTLWSDHVNNRNQFPHDWMPAPIEKWYVFDDPTELSGSDWIQLYGYQARMSTEASFTMDGEFQSSLVEGRPRELIKGVSNKWEGFLTNFNIIVGDSEYFKMGLVRTTRPTAGDVDTYSSSSPFSLVDGAMGPGGSAFAGTRALGERGTSQNDGWGCFLDMGNHDLNNKDKSISGRYANIRGSISSFNLIGFVDNHPGYILQYVSKRSTTEDKSEQTELYAINNRNFGAPFQNHPARYFKSNGSDDPSIIKEAKGPALPYSETAPAIPFATYSTLYGININSLGGGYDSFFGGNGAAFLKSVSVPFTGGSNGSAMGINAGQIGSDNNSTGGRSFKTKANHEFGIVYFDEKGRHGAVQPIGSAYVAGYDKERVSNKFGAASVVLNILHAPPPWSKHYRVVYAGNSSVEEFNQFSIANAFVPSESAESGKIYLSLSHLQSHPISYADSYGAISQQDGSDRIYRFATGDVLRIVNYTDSTGERVYLNDPYEYKVLGVENLTSTMEDHPLYVGNVATTDAAKNGEFLIIENNSENVGFTAAEVATASSNWANRCIVEVYRPKKNIGQDTPYYETNYGGRILGEGDSKTHQYNTIRMSRGDIYYRAVPVNVQQLDGANFESLISGTTTEDTSVSNFVPIFLETEGFTDFFISDTHDFGRVHFIDRDASEVKRKYSITFSESTFLGSFQPRWLSFPQIGNFKDYSFEFGEIDLLDFDGQFINSFHSHRILKIPFQRNVLSTGDSDQVVSSTKVLGTESVIPFESGSSGRPESIIKIDGDYFFFDADKKRVVMIKGGKSPQVITDLGVRNYFKTKVDKWLDDGGYRATMGYDPRNEELIISLSQKRDNETMDFGSEEEKDRLLSMGFDLRGKKGWKSRYSFATSLLAFLGENMYSFHSGSNKFPTPFMHDEEAELGEFYGTSYESSLKTALAGDPTQIKEFNALIVDANSPWSATVKSGDQEQFLDSESFKLFNDRFYRPIDGSAPSDEDLLKSVRPIKVSTFPNDSYRGVRGGKNFALKRMGDTLFVRAYLPSDHAIFKSSIPSGSGSKVVELSSSGDTLLSLGLDPRNNIVYDREYYVDEVANDYSSDGCTYITFVIRKMRPVDAQHLDTQHINLDEFVPLDSLEPTLPGYGDFAQSVIFPLLSSYIYQQGTNEEAEHTPFSDQSANMSEYDEDGDGFVTINDIFDAVAGTNGGDAGAGYVTACLLSFVSQYNQDLISVDLANKVVNQAQIAGINKQVYSVYTDVKEVILGRNLEIEMSADSQAKGSELFSVEVDYNSRNQKLSAARTATKAKKK
jgi:hypothetical protein